MWDLLKIPDYVYFCRNAFIDMRHSYPGEGNEGQWGHSSEHDGWDQHDQGNQNIIAEVGDCCQPTTEKWEKKEQND